MKLVFFSIRAFRNHYFARPKTTRQSGEQIRLEISPKILIPIKEVFALIDTLVAFSSVASRDQAPANPDVVPTSREKY
jgi:hypothetical protein